MFKWRSIYFAAIILPFIAGCGKTLRYEPRELRHLTVVSATHWDTHENVTVLVKQFTAQDNEYYFNRSKLRYEVLQLTINNRSENEWVISPASVNVDLVSLQDVCKSLNPSYIRSLGMRWLVGAALSSIYSLKQFDVKNRILNDVGVKILEQPLTIEANAKGSVILFVTKKRLRPRLLINLGHADIPGKYLNFELTIIH